MATTLRGQLERRVTTAESDLVVRITNAGVQVKEPGQTWRTAGPPVPLNAIRWQSAKIRAIEVQGEKKERPRKARRSVV